MKKILLLFLICSFSTFAQKGEKEINLLVDQWHLAAADADFDAYFSLMTKEAVFIGTDASENWQLEEFKAYSKPYFDKGKAWTFYSLERNIYLDEKGETAWFDELLETDMGICRGSGVLQQTKNGWRIKHYVLSIVVPNENVSAVKKINEEHDSALIKSFK
jgi:ketosteroid isomerase-like protein